MSIFLNGVPGRLKTLIDRLVPSGSAETLTDTRLANLDDLDAAVSTRAPSSTALSSATWTGTKAGYLDAAVSSAKYPKQTDINCVELGTSSIASVNAFSPGVPFGPIAVSAATWTEVLSVAVPGFLWWAAAWRGSAYTSGTLNVRVTIDGTVAVTTVTTGASSTQNTGVVAVGSYIGTVPLLMPIRFAASMKIEVYSSQIQSGGGDIMGSYIYTLD